jgi:hypothetical protein
MITLFNEKFECCVASSHDAFPPLWSKEAAAIFDHPLMQQN